MNKIKYLFLLLLLIITTACSSATNQITKENGDNDISSEQSNTDEESSCSLLDGYPDDVLPLYKMKTIEDTSFSYRDDYNYVVGKDIYNVSYRSSGNVNEISDYYQSLMTHIDDIEEDYFDDTFFTGNINENNVIISIYEGDDYVRVGLTIGLKESEYVDENPFFDTYPTGIVDEYEMTELQEITYKKDCFYDQIVYSKIYEADLSSEDFVDFYKEKYISKDFFYEESDQYGITYQWNDNGYEIMVDYSNYSNNKFISIYVYDKN